jgi:peptide/nickel transport system ATP-binding protein
MYAGKVVERRRSKSCSPGRATPTPGLLRSIPRRTAATHKVRLKTIPGSVPKLIWPPGCRFAERCRHADAAAARAEPPLRELGPGHKVACILPRWRRALR